MSTKPAPNVVGEHSFYKSSKGSYPQKAKGMSFFAFLLSTFVYISVFYIFNLSPSTLFNTTKFWFFVTNTIILIIAADYGAFSSSKEEQGGLYDEYMNMPSKVKTSVSSLVSQYPEVAYKEKSNLPKIRGEAVVWHEKRITTQESDSFPESNIPHEVVTNTDHSEKHHVHDHDEDWQEKRHEVLTPKADHKIRGEVVVWHEKKIITQESDSFQESNIPHEVVTNTDHSEKHHVHHDEDWQEKRHKVLTPKADHNIHSRTAYRRVKSEKARRVMIDESKNDIRWISTETAKREPNLEENDDQFSTMSDEELNRRVEEFIQRFNRQIRLQSTTKYSSEI